MRPENGRKFAGAMILPGDGCVAARYRRHSLSGLSGYMSEARQITRSKGAWRSGLVLAQAVEQHLGPQGGRIMRRAIFWTAALVGMLAAASPAMAQPLLLGGTEVAPQNSYSYFGAALPFAGARLGSGWYGTVFANYLTYHYTITQNNSPVTVGVAARGIQSGVGYAWQGAAYQLALSGALGYQYFSVHPSSAAGGGPLGSTLTFMPQVQARYDFTSSLYVSTIANYSFGPRAYWSRFRGGYRPVHWLSLGPEAIFLGGDNYRIRQLGVFAGIALGDGWSVVGEGGLTYASGLHRTGYASLSFAKTE